MGVSPFQLLVILFIVVLIFGGKRLRTLGSDLGQAIKGFKEATKEDESSPASPNVLSHQENHIIEGKVEQKENAKE